MNDTLPESTAAAEAGGSERTTYQRRYVLDPDLADEFVEFLSKDVFPAREEFGFTVESVWLAQDKSEMTWYVSRFGTVEEFDVAEKEWENSEVRAKLFAGVPRYVLEADLKPVRRLR